MKFIHLSDLHLGKRFNEFSMIEDQRYILNQIITHVEAIRPDGIFLAGDIYDKSTPSEEAVELLNEFLCRLVQLKIKTYLISGNHDSAQRLSFASEIMKKSDVYISPVYQGEITKCKLEDEYGELHIYLLPFIKPGHVRRYFPGEKIESYTDAMQVAINQMKVDRSVRNVLLTHQFVVGAMKAGSEELSVGGTDAVEAQVFDDFDYVALGHIHGPQKMTRETIRYCGTPLKYSFSEVNHQKSMTVVELLEKGEVKIETIPLIPLHDVRILRGSYNELTYRENYKNTACDDYLQIVLTDEEDILDALARLRTIYPNVMQLRYDNQRTRENAELTVLAEVEARNPLDLFNEFYQKQNNQPMTSCQQAFVAELIEKIKEGRE